VAARGAGAARVPRELKLDLYPEDVYVFTPQGRRLLRSRAAPTPLDFAYRIHTDLGHRCTGARINGKLEPLRTALRNGDIVEVPDQPGRPSQPRLAVHGQDHARALEDPASGSTSQQKQQAEEIGRACSSRSSRRSGCRPRRRCRSAEMKELLAGDGLQRVEDLYSRIGFGKSPVKSVVRRPRPAARRSRREREEPGRAAQGGGASCSRSTAPRSAFAAKATCWRRSQQCCTPGPGRARSSASSRAGRGISVHSEDCANVRNLLYHPEREIDVEVGRTRPTSSTQWSCGSRPRISPACSRRLTEAIAKHDANIKNSMLELGVGRAKIEVMLEVPRPAPSWRACARPSRRCRT
jgi:GTP pyrophosphokinase